MTTKTATLKYLDTAYQMNHSDITDKGHNTTSGGAEGVFIFTAVSHDVYAVHRVMVE